MLQRITFGLTMALLASATPAFAESAAFKQRGSVSNSGKELPPYLQCVPYARQQSGIGIYGDAHTWWKQAQGKFKRGNRPKVGAVMAFQPHGNMRLGHVAAVSRIIDKRTVLLRHSNWSPINGRRGQIENDVRAIDVSRKNDWSQVRVWYDPIKGLGKTAWPIHGFIYSDKAPKFETPSFRAPVRAPTRIARVSTPKPVSRAPSPGFTSAFANLSAPAKARAPSRAVRTVRSVPAPHVNRNSVNRRVQSAISLYD